MLVSRFCVKVSDDFAVYERDINIQEGNGLERVIDPLMSVSISALLKRGSRVKGEGEGG